MKKVLFENRCSWVWIDPSREACKARGYAPRQIVFRGGDIGVVVGVGPATINGKEVDVVWCLFNKDNGKVRYLPPSQCRCQKKLL
ncbi:MAG: hypothetical protein NTY33_04640 [Candidatus Moranbacteria bacterium]|nr:hypothetical protein [Candidatus Moranbacteria bacterium]